MKNASILLVDDDRHVLESMASWLQDQGYGVDVAGGCREALNRLEDGKYDLVLCDIRLQDGDGFDVLQHCCTHHPNLTVILITGFGYDPNHAIVRAGKEGLAGVLFKPFKVDQLLDEVRNALEQASA